jgi:hypothetical protein
VLATQRVRSPFHFRFTVDPGVYTLLRLNDPPVRVQAAVNTTTTVQLPSGECG